jgi:hypothetical protein
MFNKIHKNYLKYIFLSFLLICFISIYRINIGHRGKRVGIIGFMPDTNIGNNLLKYSMYIFLKKNGFIPTLISIKKKVNIFFKKKIKNKRNTKLLFRFK